MKEDHFYYFAYGSNISTTTLRKYCPSAEKICVAKLNNYRLDFQFWATIVPHPNKHVWGLVWQIHNRDVSRLDYYEDVENNLYRVIQVTVDSQVTNESKITPTHSLTTDDSQVTNESKISPTHSLTIPDDSLICRCYEMTANIAVPSLEEGQNVNKDLIEQYKPATWYMKNIIDACVAHGIPNGYVEELKSVPTQQCAFRE